jgi:hypothetical protein
MLKPMLAALLISAQAPGVPAPPTRCLTRTEVGDLTLVGASVAVEVVRNACRTYLPATAFLETPAGAAFSARLRVEGQHRLDSALDGVARMSGGANMPRTGVRAMIMGMMTEGAGTDLAQHADVSLCRDVNEMMEIASTLSPDQMARFVGAVASIADHVARMQAAQHPIPAPPAGAAPAPHPAALEMAPTPSPRPVIVPTAPPPVVIVPASRSHRPALTPFLCSQPQ